MKSCIREGLRPNQRCAWWGIKISNSCLCCSWIKGNLGCRRCSKTVKFVKEINTHTCIVISCWRECWVSSISQVSVCMSCTRGSWTLRSLPLNWRRSRTMIKHINSVIDTAHISIISVTSTGNSWMGPLMTH